MNIYHFAVNNMRMNIFTTNDRIINSLKLPISFMSAFLIIMYFISLIFGVGDNVQIMSFFIWSALSGGFVASYITHNSEKTVIISSSVITVNVIFYLVNSRTPSILATLFIAYFLCKIIAGFDLTKFCVISIFVSVLLGFSFAYLYILIESFTRFLADLVNTNSFLFSFINEIYTLIIGDDFSQLFYFKDYGSAIFINEEIASGAVNIFSADKANPASAVSVYLTGKYFANIFLPIGIYVCLFSKIKDRYFIPVTISLILSILCGNNLMFSTFLFFYNPIIYLSYVICTSLCYLFINLADVRLGFVDSASLIELVKYSNDILIFIIIGIVSMILMYFLCLVVLSKYDFDFYRYIPKSVRKLIDALGGEKNIISIDSYTVTVKNPNLVNILNIDCDLHENIVNLIDDDYDLLLKYIT